MAVCSMERRISPRRANSVTLLRPRPNFCSGPAHPVARKPTATTATAELINLSILNLLNLVFLEISLTSAFVKRICPLKSPNSENFLGALGDSHGEPAVYHNGLAGYVVVLCQHGDHVRDLLRGSFA